LSSKVKVSFNLDLSQIAPEVLLDASVSLNEGTQEAVTKLLLRGARKTAKDELRKLHRDAVIDADVKVIKTAELMRKIMFTLMAEANMEVEELPESTEIQTQLPFEREYEAPRKAA
jgi:hypothetical protein